MADAGVDHAGAGLGASAPDSIGSQEHARDAAEKEVGAVQQDGGDRSHPARTEGPSGEAKAASAASSGSDTETEVEEITLESSPDGEQGSHAVSDEYVEQAENLVVGTWLELTEEDGSSVRIKLSWKSDVSDAYIFVNRKGIKVAEMTLQGLAMLFRRKTAVVLEEIDVPIMDRALHSMVEALKKHKEATSGSTSSS